jgi:Myb-like DNA-binding domain
MAQNYRVPAEFNIDFSAQEPHHQQRSYEPHPHQQLQHAGASSLDPLHAPPHSQHHHTHLGYGSAPMQPHLAYGTAPMQSQIGPKRSRQHDELELDLGGLHGGMQDEGMESMSQQSLGGYEQPPQQRYHGHQLPVSARPPKMPRQDETGESSMSQGAPSVVGQPGMPAPAPKPRGPKLKFTPEDDGLLVELKENRSLTWKQIAEFFPGRSSGTLQVRYCTKLKAKTTQWTDETVSLSTRRRSPRTVTDTDT